jgi:hypothetical protein
MYTVPDCAERALSRLDELGQVKAGAGGPVELGVDAIGQMAERLLQPAAAAVHDTAAHVRSSVRTGRRRVADEPAVAPGLEGAVVPGSGKPGQHGTGVDGQHARVRAPLQQGSTASLRILLSVRLVRRGTGRHSVCQARDEARKIKRRLDEADLE